MSRYRYAYDSARTAFDESAWIGAAWNQYPCGAEDTEATHCFMLAAVFAELRRRGILIPENAPDPIGEDPFPLRCPPNAPIGCPSCHHVHVLSKHGWLFPCLNHLAYYTPYEGWK